ncbi:MAG: Cytochrome P450, partial [uncultured Nocardioidaceae bacterium]
EPHRRPPLEDEHAAGQHLPGPTRRPAAQGPAVARTGAERGTHALPPLVHPRAAEEVRRRVRAAAHPGAPAAGPLRQARHDQADLRQRPRGVPRRQGQRGAGPDHGRALAAPRRRCAAQARAQAADAGVPAVGDGRLREGRHADRPGRGRLLDPGRRVPQPRADELADAGGDPPGRLRRRRRGAAGGAPPAGEPDCRHQAADPARLGLPVPAAVRSVEEGRRGAAAARRTALRRDRRAAQGHRPPRADRRALTAAAGRRQRGRGAAVRRRAARPARHVAARRARDDGVRAVLGALRARTRRRPAVPSPARSRQRGRRLPRGGDEGVPAAAPDHPDGGAVPDGAGHHRRRTPACGCLRRPLDHPRPPRPGQLPRARPLPARAVPRRRGRGEHVDPFRRRRTALHRRGLLAHGGRRRPARGAAEARRAGGRRAHRPAPGPQHHQRAGAGRPDRGDRPGL